MTMSELEHLSSHDNESTKLPPTSPLRDSFSLHKGSIKEELITTTNTETNNNNKIASSSSSSKEEEEEEEVLSLKERWKKRKVIRIWRLFLFVPYFIGIIWTCLHPIVSIVTGELKCRGWYIDENALDTQFASVTTYDPPKHLLSLSENKLKQQKHKQKQKQKQKQNIPFDLCDNFNNNYSFSSSSRSNIACYRHEEGKIDVAILVPVSGGVEPIEEAIVLVVPAPPIAKDWTTSHFHTLLLHCFFRLANPIDTPWLAKTVILVSPTTRNNSEKTSSSSLGRTVAAFLDAYLGSKYSSSKKMISHIPLQLSTAMLRNLIVLDVDTIKSSVNNNNVVDEDESSYTDLTILPQGRRGVLPNMDLVFMVGMLYTKPMFMQERQYPKSSFYVHPYKEQSKMIQEYITTNIIDKIWNTTTTTTTNKNDLIQKRKVQKWTKDFINLCLFVKTLGIGPYPPHAEALDRGIDSLTIKIKFHNDNSDSNNGGGGGYWRDPTIEFIQYLEYLIRALSNLHERLHHSITLYLLPSPQMFVSHIEYLLPTILLLLPLVVRAVQIVIQQMECIHLKTVLWTILSAILAITCMFLSSLFTATTTTTATHSEEDISIINIWLLAPYIIMICYWIQELSKRGYSKDDNVRIIQSMHFVACVTAIYIHVPIAFAHVSIAYPSALLWTPLLAFPNYGGFIANGNKWPTRFGIVLLVFISPPLLVSKVFSTYTTFVQFAYVPLHVQLSIILLISQLV